MLNSKRVDEIFTACLFKDNEDASLHVAAEGIVRNVGFHPERLKSHETEIVAMLDELPEAFKESGGGGMSFLSACYDKHGNQWTGAHQHMEQLFQLGIAVKKVKCPMEREMWDILPGGMPYYVVTI